MEINLQYFYRAAVWSVHYVILYILPTSELSTTFYASVHPFPNVQGSLKIAIYCTEYYISL